MGRSIYKRLEPGDSSWISTIKIETLLRQKLVGIDLSTFPIRTRSKFVKTAVCEALGYEVPRSFKKTQPRFPCQNLDVYTQKSNNLQIWNEELDGARRYALIKPDENGVVKSVKVVTGEDLIPLDKTGKLTQKYQASYRQGGNLSILLSSDSSGLDGWLCQNPASIALSNIEPTKIPEKGQILPIDIGVRAQIWSRSS